MVGMRRFVLILALALGLAAPTGAATGGGLYGVVMRGPVTPVCTADAPCDAPAAGVTLIFVRNGAVVARAITAHDGRYRVVLGPGTYAVRGPKRMTPVSAMVLAGRMGRLNFTIDTGIR